MEVDDAILHFRQDELFAGRACHFEELHILHRTGQDDPKVAPQLLLNDKCSTDLWRSPSCVCAKKEVLFVRLFNVPISAQNIDENIRKSLQSIWWSFGHGIVGSVSCQCCDVTAEVVEGHVEDCQRFFFHKSSSQSLHGLLVIDFFSGRHKNEGPFRHAATCCVLQKEVSAELKSALDAAFFVVQKLKRNSTEKAFSLVVRDDRRLHVDPRARPERHDPELRPFWQVWQEPEDSGPRDLPSLAVVDVHGLRDVDGDDVTFRWRDDKVEGGLDKASLVIVGLVLVDVDVLTHEVRVWGDDFFRRFSVAEHVLLGGGITVVIGVAIAKRLKRKQKENQIKLNSGPVFLSQNDEIR